MARVKNIYKTKAERDKALKQTEEQYNRAKDSLVKSQVTNYANGDLPIGKQNAYMQSQELEYRRRPEIVKRMAQSRWLENKEILKSLDYAFKKYTQRNKQLDQAYQNRVASIKAASIANNAG